MKVNDKKPNKDKDNGYIVISHLNKEEFNTMTEQISMTMEMFERFRDWKEKEPEFKRKVKDV